MRILLLGNGFDLYHKFPTRYDNFLHTVDFLLQHYDEKSMLTIGDIFGDKRLLESDKFIPICYDAYREAYADIVVDKEKVQNIISIAKDNIWFKYFLSSYNRELGWIDFEREIATVLNSFEVLFTNCDDVDNIEFPDDRKDEYILKFFDFYYEYTQSVYDKTINVAYVTYKILECFKNEIPYGSKNMVIDKYKIISKLYNELLEFSEILKLYLMVFVNESIGTLLQKNLISKSNVFVGVDEVITFNYTKTFEKIYSAKNIHHIHGDLKNKIILGVNPDKSDEFDYYNSIDTDFLRFKKYYQRVLNASDIGYLKLIKNFQEEKNVLGEFFRAELYVAGHSLDNTDEDIIKEVFSYASKIVIICHNESAIAESINNLVKIYGKSDFDNIRFHTDMKFKLYSDFEQ